MIFIFFLSISFFLFHFFLFHSAYTFRWCGLWQDFMVDFFKSLPGVLSSRVAGHELPPLPLQLVKTKDHLPSPPCSTLATSPPTSPFASTPRGVAPSPLPELRYETTVEEVSSGPSYVIFCYVHFWPLLATSGLLCSLLSILHPGISLNCAGFLSVLPDGAVAVCKGA